MLQITQQQHHQQQKHERQRAKQSRTHHQLFCLGFVILMQAQRHCQITELFLQS